MAYRGETTEMMAVAGQMSVEAAPAMVVKPTVAAADRRRVRLAIASIVVLAVVDLVLYLPRLL